MNTSYQAYSNIELDTEIMAASGHRLIQLLMERCLQQIHFAKNAIAECDIHRKHKTITAAMSIVVYLRSCLNFEDERTKELSNTLNVCYDFLEKSLLQATIKNEAVYLDQASNVLTNIKSGWDEMAHKG